MTKKVLITNSGNRIAYLIIKNLANKGTQIHCGDFKFFSPLKFSRYCFKHFTYPNPYIAQEDFIDYIVQYCQDEKIDILWPTYDETFLISKKKNLFPKNIIIIAPDYEGIEKVHNKPSLYKIANELDIPIPRTWYIQSRQDIIDITHELSFPLVLKPERGGGGLGG